MSRITLYSVAWMVFLGAMANSVEAFTVSISNYGCQYSGWEDGYDVDQDGNSQYWYWSGTATERIHPYAGGWTTSSPSNLDCRVSEHSGATITSSGAVPGSSYLWLNGYVPHVCGSLITFHQFDFDLSWSRFGVISQYYVYVLSRPYGGYWDTDLAHSTSYWTMDLSMSGSCHVSGDLMGTGVPVIVFSDIPPARTVPEPSTASALLAALACVCASAIRWRRCPFTPRPMA